MWWARERKRECTCKLVFVRVHKSKRAYLSKKCPTRCSLLSILRCCCRVFIILTSKCYYWTHYAAYWALLEGEPVACFNFPFFLFSHVVQCVILGMFYGDIVWSLVSFKHHLKFLTVLSIVLLSFLPHWACHCCLMWCCCPGRCVRPADRPSWWTSSSAEDHWGWQG